MNTTLMENTKLNVTNSNLLLKAFIAILCLLCFLLSLLGNSLVVSVIIRYKRLKNATNYILLSLAIADLTVSFLVMLPATIQDVKDKWIFNDTFCKIYNAFDITCCTASILHLLLVALDRYIAIFRPLKYKNLVRKWHVFMLVVFVWTLSLCISFIPIFMGWNLESKPEILSSSSSSSSSFNLSTSSIDNNTTTTTSDDSKNSVRCTIEANKTYALISSSLSFYIPLFIMTIVYARIFTVARRQANAIAEIEMRALSYYNAGKLQQKFHEAEQLKKAKAEAQLNDVAEDSLLRSNSKNALENSNTNCTLNNNVNQIDESNNDEEDTKESKRSSRTRTFLKFLRSLKIIQKRKTKDTKAITTLGIIMGIFIICWLPFFIMYLVQAFKPFNIEVDPLVDRIITWIGYTNSFINPIVYALTNRDFRKAYKSTIKSCAKYLCPKSIYFKIIDENSTEKKNYLHFKKITKQQASLNKQRSNQNLNNNVNLDKANNRNKAPLSISSHGHEQSESQIVSEHNDLSKKSSLNARDSCYSRASISNCCYICSATTKSTKKK